MKQQTLLKTGITGSLIAAICCVTPVLVVLMGAMGVAAFIGYMDYVLMPALVVFLGITAYAFFGKKKCKGEDDECNL